MTDKLYLWMSGARYVWSALVDTLAPHKRCLITFRRRRMGMTIYMGPQLLDCSQTRLDIRTIELQFFIEKHRPVIMPPPHLSRQ